MSEGFYNIRVVKHADIDRSKWDQCILNAGNGRIYAQSFYLDHLAGSWQGIVYKDYEAVMPLTWKRKWGIRYLYQPAFIQQGGIFGQQLSIALMEAILNLARQSYRFAEINLNSGNEMQPLPAKHNFILSLHSDYDTIRASYKKDMIHNLKETERFPLIYETTPDFNAAIRLYQQQYGPRTPHVKQSDYNRFGDCCRAARELGKLIIRKVSNKPNELQAIAIFLKDEKRIYNLMSVTLPGGREQGANHFLFDQLIREYAGSSLILDFEGSEIPGIAGFYQKFGSRNEPYFVLRYNHLPFPINQFKK